MPRNSRTLASLTKLIISVIIKYMSHERYINRPSLSLEAARDIASEAAENPEYADYAAGEGPLLLEEVLQTIHDERRTKLLNVAMEFGWPGPEDAGIEPVHDYSDMKFLDELFCHRLDKEQSLDNFILYLRADAIEPSLLPANVSLDALMGQAPHVHRAQALMPDLMDALRVIYRKLPFNDSHFSREFLTMPENWPIVTATNMVYRVKGRLVKVSDFDPPVTSAHDALTSL